MSTTIDRKKQSYLTDLEGKMHLERTAIIHNIQNLRDITPVVKSFDHKVINKRFNDALKEVVGHGVYCEILANSKNLIARFQGGVKVNDKWKYPQGYERVVIAMEMNQLNNKRLDADKTIESIEQNVSRLEKQAERFVYDEEVAIERYEKLMAIEASIEALMEESDSLTSEALRNMSYRIR